MAAKSARSAAKRIDRDRWGKGRREDAKANCPLGCEPMYRIHPAVGVARVGDAPDEFFIGAETDSFKTPERFYDLSKLNVDPANRLAETLVRNTADKTVYKDKKGTTAPVVQGRIRRQGARFRIFEYRKMKDDSWAWVREITSDEAEIKWTVKLANKKAEYHEFNGPILSNAKMRVGPTIEPPEKPLPIKHKWDPATDAIAREKLEEPGKVIDYLGEILHDDKGRLIVLGGRGAAKLDTSFSGDARYWPNLAARRTSYANNGGWVDDVSDGWIKAEVTFPREKTTPAKTYKTETSEGDAWVLVGPPDFAPELSTITSMYDTMLDIAVREYKDGRWVPTEKNKVMYDIHGIVPRAQVNYRPYFDYDLLRLFEATYLTATVFKPANPGMKHPAVYKLSQDTNLDNFNAKTPAAREENERLRYKIFNTLRPPKEKRRRDPRPIINPSPTATNPPNAVDAGNALDGKIATSDPDYEAPPTHASTKDVFRYDWFRWSMPYVYGDAEEDYHDARAGVTQLQYDIVKHWWKGAFEEVDAATFDLIPKSSAITPGGLDRSALDHCVGGPFYPGIEASWLTRSAAIYAEPFRVKKGNKAKEITVGCFTSVGVATSPKATVDAGFFSQQMAQPWHADFFSCAREDGVGWWPAQRPDEVVTPPTPANKTALRAFTPASTTAVTLTAADLDAAGLAGLDARARNITFTIKYTSSKNHGKPPPKVTITGTDEDGGTTDGFGGTFSDTVELPENAQTKAGGKLFKAITSIVFEPAIAPAKLEIAIGIGEFAGGMEDWAAGVHNYKENVESWSRLGFVVKGVEIERDPNLPLV